MRPSFRRSLALLWPIPVAGLAAPLLRLLITGLPAEGAGRYLAGVLILAATSALLALGVGSWWLRRKLFRPLAEINAAAARLAAGELGNRSDLPEMEELGALAADLRRVADRVETRIERLESERDELREATARDLKKTLRLSEIRRDLVANVSHELKTPLTAIRGYAETLQDGALEEPGVALGFVGSILEQCARLEALLRDLLTLSRLEGREKPHTLESVDLSHLARHAVEVLSPQSRARQVEVSLDIPATLPAIAGDREELERLFLNLVENAIKYNRRGGRVEVRLVAGEDEVLLEVEDDGIGIPEDALGRVFERFYRVDKGRARDQGGTGLGLSIVKHAARAHGGRVEVDSRLGEGSVFRVYLPRT